MATAQPLNQQQQVRLPISILLDLAGLALDIFIRGVAPIAHFRVQSTCVLQSRRVPLEKLMNVFCNDVAGLSEYDALIY